MAKGFTFKKKKKKSLQATSKSTMWYGCCSSGKLRATEVLEVGRIGRVSGKGVMVSVDHAQEGGKSQSSLS